jgi:hypothetical protein
MDKPVALLQVSEPALRAWAAARDGGSGQSTTEQSWAALLADPAAAAWACAQLNAEGVKQGLGRNCLLGAVRLLSTPWTPANGAKEGGLALQSHRHAPTLRPCPLFPSFFLLAFSSP